MSNSSANAYRVNDPEAGTGAAGADRLDPLFWERILSDEGLYAEPVPEPLAEAHVQTVVPGQTGQGDSGRLACELPTLEAEGLDHHAEILYLGSAGHGMELADESAAAEMVGAFGGIPDSTAGEVESSSGRDIRPRLTRDDRELIERIKERGYAVTLDELFFEIGASPESVVRLVEAGEALSERVAGGQYTHTLFVLASATGGDVRRAGRRADAMVIGERFEGKVASCRRIASDVLDRLHSLGGACSEAELVGGLVLDHGAPRFAVEAVLAELGHEGEIRRVCSRGGARILLALSSAAPEQLAAASRRVAEVEAASRANRRLPRKSFARPASAYDPTDEPPVDTRALDRAGEMFREAARRARRESRSRTETIPPAVFARRILDTLERSEERSWRSIAASSPLSPVATEAVLSRLEAKNLVTRRYDKRIGLIFEAATTRTTPGGAIPERAARKLNARRNRRERARKLIERARRKADPERIALDTAAATLVGREGKEAKLLLKLARSGELVPLGELGSSLSAIKPLGRDGLLEGRTRRASGEAFCRITRDGRRTLGRKVLAILAESDTGIRVPKASKLEGRLKRIQFASRAA
jgi:hypothetical protein